MTTGQLAYTAYKLNRDHEREVGDLPTPEWDRLPKTLQRAWEITAAELNRQMEVLLCSGSRVAA